MILRTDSGRVLQVSQNLLALIISGEENLSAAVGQSDSRACEKPKARLLSAPARSDVYNSILVVRGSSCGGCSGPDSSGLLEPPSEPFKSQKWQIFPKISRLKVCELVECVFS